MQTNEGACTKGTQLIYTQEKVGLKKTTRAVANLDTILSVCVDWPCESEEGEDSAR